MIYGIKKFTPPGQTFQEPGVPLRGAHPRGWFVGPATLGPAAYYEEEKERGQEEEENAAEACHPAHGTGSDARALEER